MICKCGWDMRKQKFELQEEEVLDFKTYSRFVLKQRGKIACAKCFAEYKTMFRAEVVEVGNEKKTIEGGGGGVVGNVRRKDEN